MKTMKSIQIATGCLLALGAMACGEEEATVETRSLALQFEGLEDLGADYVYEGWIMVDGAPKTAGRFTVSADGTLNPASFELDAADLDVATAYILTIEPATGDDPAPSKTHVVAGDIASGAANLTIGHPAALGDDLTGAAGTFILATPTSTAMDDDAQGIWFLDMSSGSPMASLTLPTLPEGWAYEGWIVDTSGAELQPFSTGTFTAVDAADSDGAGAEAGDQGFPPFPGQDYIDPARVLTSNHMAVISIEPVPDNSPAPFRIKPLGTMIGTDVGGMNPQTLGDMLADNTITGSLTIE